MKKAFNTAGLKRAGESSNAFIDAIRRKRPELENATFYVPGSGSCAHTLIVENEVFKAPLTDKTLPEVLAFMLEYNVQKRFSECGLPVPALTDLGDETLYFGMERIDGCGLTKELIDTLTPEQRTALAQDIAKAIVGMGKAFSDEELKNFSIRTEGGKKQLTADAIDAALADPKTLRALGRKTAFCQEAMRQYKARFTHKKQHVIHADLYAENILVNPETKNLAAVIDFGRTAYTVPEVALIYIQGPALVSQICDEYSKLAGESLTYKDVLLCRLYQGITSLSTMVTAADRKGINFSMQAIIDAEKQLKGLETPKTAPAAKLPKQP